MPELPSGAVTFLFSDIEGSTRLLKELREDYSEALEEQQRLLRAAFDAAGGEEVDTQGDAFFVAFRRARDAIAAAAAGQRSLSDHEWPRDVQLRVRMGIHTGEAALSGKRYLGVAVNRAARICAAGHGGQVLVSQTTKNLLEDEEVELADVDFRDLGEQRLKDLDRPVRLYQLVAPGLATEFPPIRTAATAGDEAQLAEALAKRLGSRHRRKRILAAIGTLAVLGVGAAVAAELVGAGGGSKRVPLNAVGAIDPKTNKVFVVVPVGAEPVGVVAAYGGIWVINQQDQTLMRIDPGKREVVKTIALAGQPTGIAAGDGSIWVLNASSPATTNPAAEITQVSPSFNDVTTRIGTDLGYGDVVEGLLAVGGGSIWVPNPIGDNPRQVVERIDEHTQRVLARRPAVGTRAAADGATYGDGAFWFGDARGLVKVDPASNGESVVGTSVGGGVAVGANAVWVGAPFEPPSRTTTTRGYVSKIDLGATAVRGTAPAPDPVAVAVGDGSVWVANRNAHTVERIDPATNRVQATIELGSTPTAIAVGKGAVWVVAS